MVIVLNWTEINKMSQEKTIELPCYGIKVSLTGNGGGSVTSDLHESPEYEADDFDPEDAHGCFDYNNMMEGIEAMILGHAIAGIDITTPAYIEGIESAVQGCANNS